MTEHITVKPAKGMWVVRAGGAVLGETTRAMEVREGSNPPVIYFPREDIAMAFLDATEKKTKNTLIGEANYFSIIAKSGPIANAAWSYETPSDAVSGIAGYLAFNDDRVTIENI